MEQFKGGLSAPICLTWEWTYACNLSCAHCLSSSGLRDPDELTTDEMRSVIDELRAMQVFYVNVGGGEPTVRPDFWELLDYAVANQVGVKFSTNGLRLDAERAQRLAATDYVDVQVSLDGASRQVNDAVRGHGSYDMALRAMENLAEAGFRNFKISVVMTRHNVPQLDEFAALADRFGAQLRITRLRPSGRGADVWPELHPTDQQQREIYCWLLDHGDRVLTGDSFFHLNALGATALPGLNLCGAGRVVCLIDPVGDVYACPFAIHEAFKAGTVAHRAVSPRCGAQPRCSPGCAPKPQAERAAPARLTIPARADAWRRSSSPACRWTDPIRSASRDTAPASFLAGTAAGCRGRRRTILTGARPCRWACPRCAPRRSSATPVRWRSRREHHPDRAH